MCSKLAANLSISKVKNSIIQDAVLWLKYDKCEVDVWFSMESNLRYMAGRDFPKKPLVPIYLSLALPSLLHNFLRGMSSLNNAKFHDFTFLPRCPPSFHSCILRFSIRPIFLMGVTISLPIRRGKFPFFSQFPPIFPVFVADLSTFLPIFMPSFYLSFPPYSLFFFSFPG